MVLWQFCKAELQTLTIKQEYELICEVWKWGECISHAAWKLTVLLILHIKSYESRVHKSQRQCISCMVVAFVHFVWKEFDLATKQTVNELSYTSTKWKQENAYSYPIAKFGSMFGNIFSDDVYWMRWGAVEISVLLRQAPIYNQTTTQKGCIRKLSY